MLCCCIVASIQLQITPQNTPTSTVRQVCEAPDGEVECLYMKGNLQPHVMFSKT